MAPPEGGGTPYPVELSQDIRARLTWAVFVGAPVIWFAHFMLVYLVAEAGCTGGLPLLDPPVPVALTLISTVLAVGACSAMAGWTFRRWRASSRELESVPDGRPFHELDADRRRGSLAFAGFLLSIFSAVAVLFTGAPALVLGPC